MKTQPCVIPSLVVVFGLLAGPAAAQTSEAKFEVGGHLSTLRIGAVGNTNAGIGGRVSYDFFRWLALEGEFNYFPEDRIYGTTSLTLQTQYLRRRFEGFVGPRIGLRHERFGVFAKVRPGFAHLVDRGMRCTGDMCPLALFVRPEYDPEFALDLGGVFEFYPTAHVITRFDAGTTLFRHRSFAAPPCPSRQCTTQNFSTSLGMGVRF